MIWSYVAAVLVSLLLVSGAFVSVLAALGLLRLPDVYSRMHAASLAGTIGTGLILIGFAIHEAQLGLILRALATLLFLMVTAPVAAHLLAKAASTTRDPRAPLAKHK